MMRAENFVVLRRKPVKVSQCLKLIVHVLDTIFLSYQ